MSALVLMSATEAQRLTQRIKLTASGVRDGLFKLRNLVDEAKNSNAWQVLGFASWTAYLADTLADEPMRLGREERQELVGYLSGEGLSTRAIAPIVGASVSTVKTDVQVANSGHLVNDIDSPVSNDTPDAYVDPSTGEVIPAAMVDATDDEFERALSAAREEGDLSSENVVAKLTRQPVIGLDGKSYTRPSAKADRRRSLVDDAYTANTNLWKAIESIRTIRNDDRFTRNKADILAALQPSADLAIEILTDLFNIINITVKEN